jgi:hypothetical protein
VFLLSELSYQELRSQGRTISFYENSIRIKQNTINKYESRLAERERLGLDTTGQRQRIEQAKTGIEESREKINILRSSLGDNFDLAIKAAPKKYQTGKNKEYYSVTTATGKKYVGGNESFLQQKAQQQNDIMLSRTGKANFSDMNNGASLVTYSLQEESINRPLSTGITRELEKKGAFGKSFASEKIGFSAEIIKKNPLDYRPQYSSSYGYSTKTGRTELFFGEKKDEFIEPSAKNILSDYKKIGSNYLSRQEKGISPPTKKEQNAILGAPSRFINLGLYKTGSYLERQGIKEKTPNIFIGRYIKEQGLGGYYDPAKQLSYGGISTFAGIGLGKVTGSGIKWLAKKEIARTGKPIISAGIQRVGLPTSGVLGAGILAYEVGTSTGVKPSYSAVTFAGSAVGFGKGYTSIIRPTTVTTIPYGKVTPRGLSLTESGREASIISSQRAKIVVDDLGIKNTYYRTTKINARTVQGEYGQLTDIPWMLRTRTSVPLRGKKTLIESEYASTYFPAKDGNVGVFAGINRRTGEGFETIVSPNIDANFVKTAGFDTELNILRTTNFKNERLTSVFEGVSRREAVDTNIVKFYRGTKELGLSFRTFRIVGLTRGKTTITDVIVTNIESFRGMNLLKKRNLIVESEGYKLRKFKENTKNVLEEGFFPTTTKRLYSGIMLEKQTYMPASILKPRSEGLPSEKFNIPEIAGIGGTTKQFGRNKIFFGYAKSPKPSSINTVSATNNIFSQDIFNPEKIIITPNTNYKTSILQKTSPITTYDSSFSTFNDPKTITPYPFNPTPQIPPPPIITGGLFIPPLWGIGGSQNNDVLGAKQNYNYVPSFGAGIFNIKGSQPKTLTGLEVRPLKTRRGKIWTK